MRTSATAVTLMVWSLFALLGAAEETVSPGGSWSKHPGADINPLAGNETITLNPSPTGVTMPVTPGNPFFRTSHDHLDVWVQTPPPEILQLLHDTGCKWAWRRQSHEESALDKACTDIVLPFIKSHPGATLGLLRAVVTTEVVGSLDGVYNWREEIAILTAEEFMHSDGAGNVKVDLSTLGWEGDVPPPMEPIQGFNLTELELMTSRGGNALPYVFHMAGKWSMHSVGAMSDELTSTERLQKARYAAEMWTTLGQHYFEQDPALEQLRLYSGALAASTNPGVDEYPDKFGQSLLQHGVHGVHWTIVEAFYERNVTWGGSSFAKPSPGVWKLNDYLCNGTESLNPSVYQLCTHGVGHTLTWYVSSLRGTIQETLDVCTQHPTSGVALVNECFEGFYHEMENANLWRMPELGQRFLPIGINAPCDNAPVAENELIGRKFDTSFACFGEVAATGKTYFAVHRWAPEEWFEIIWLDREVGQTGWADQKRAVKLTDEGVRAWKSSVLSFCAGSPYPGYNDVGTASCIAAMVDWIELTVAKRMNTREGQRLKQCPDLPSPSPTGHADMHCACAAGCHR